MGINSYPALLAESPKYCALSNFIALPNPMSYRLTKIYTRTGDDGSTGLSATSRVQKCDARMEAIGEIDELNSVIGVLLTEDLPADAQQILITTQHRLFDLGGELAMPEYQILDATHTTALENAIDQWNTDLPPLKDFILPGGGRGGALCHVARTVCRRAERSLVQLHHVTPQRAEALRYLNRLSDLLFVLARMLNREANQEVVYWQKPG